MKARPHPKITSTYSAGLKSFCSNRNTPGGVIPFGSRQITQWPHGGYREIPVQTEFPSATIAFFQFGALTFNIEDFIGLASQPFIDPDDMAKLKQLQRLELTLPVRNVSLKAENTLTDSVRKAVYDFFRTELEHGLESLRWFIFQE